MGMLLSKVKDGSEEALDEVKDQPIETIKKLEEKIKRLQIYNQDLRTELFKDRSNSRRNGGIPDLEEDVNSNEDQGGSSPDEVSDNELEPASFVTNVLVMDNVFGYLDVNQLKKCRIICKDWNEVISSILSKLNNGNGLAVNLYSKKDDLEKISQEIYLTVEAAPQNWFRTVNLDNISWTRDAYNSVLRDFGNRVKVINVTTDKLDVQTLRSILLDWCPNLEEFAFRNFEQEFEVLRGLQVSRPLKLTRLSFSVDSIDESFPLADVILAEVIFTILKNSPNLKKLESLGYNNSIRIQLFLKMQNYPQIMNNLEEMYLRNEYFEDIQDSLETLSKIHFKSKLKKLILTVIKPEQSTALNRLLNKTSETLEKLFLILDIDPDLPSSVEESNFQLKQMNCLREFRYYAHQKVFINSIDILAQMPKLETFVLGIEFKYWKSADGLIDAIFCNSRQLMEIPHRNLKGLSLFGYIQNPKATFDVIERGFPNLNKLVITICNKEGQNYDNVSELFKGISKLKKLTKLFLDLSSFDHDPSKLRTVLPYFENLPNLVHLMMLGGEFELSEDFFNKIPKVQKLTLIDVKMNLAKVKKFVQILDERDIYLDVKEEYEFPADGIKWYLEF